MMRHSLAVLVLVASVAALAGCPMDQGFGVTGGGGGGGGPVEDPYWCCDPDEGACVCEGYWHCTEGFAGKQCEQENPNMPDDGGQGAWDCAYRGELIVCRGNDADHPDAGADGEWNCTRAEGLVECSRTQDQGDHPDDGDGPWDCVYSADGRLRSCEEVNEDGGAGGAWDCTTGRDGTTTCVNESGDQPDGGDWSCVQAGGRDICEGDHYPDGEGASGWDCFQQGEIVRCENDEAQQPPDDGGGAAFDCEWNDGRQITCISRGDDGTLGGGGDNPGDNPNDGNPGDNPDDDVPNDGNEGGNDGGDGGDCACPPGAWRYCDTPTYCEWGTQDCIEPEPGRAEWSPCVESGAPNGCWNGGMYDAEAEQCAIDAGFCAQDFWDLDWDGDTNETLGDGCQELACVDPGDGGGFGGWGF